MKRLLFIALLVVFSCEEEPEPKDCAGIEGGIAVEDIDGNCYATMEIGEQLWMAENLKVTRYNDGSEIPTGYTNDEWVGLETGAYAVYPLDGVGGLVSTCEGDCAEVYGNLYNWYAVDDERGICPEGWHMPSDGEFVVLEMHLGMSELEAYSDGNRGFSEGSQLAGNSDLWYNGDLENHHKFGTSGFTALPGGYIHSTGNISSLSTFGYFWSSTENTDGARGGAYCRELHYNTTYSTRNPEQRNYGFSIRCLQD